MQSRILGRMRIENRNEISALGSRGIGDFKRGI